MNDDNYIRLFGQCLIVKGATRSLLCDLQKGISHIIPNNIHELSQLFSKFTIGEIKEKYDTESVAFIEDYFNYLTSNNFAFYCEKEELHLFPELSLEWDYPSIISNAIIDVDFSSKFNFDSILGQLEKLGCRHIQIRIYDVLPFSEIESILKEADNRCIKSIQLFLKFDPTVNSTEFVNLHKRFPRITGIFIHSSSRDKVLKSEDTMELSNTGETKQVFITETKQRIESSHYCGVIDKMYFTTTTELFTEGLLHNTCLNRKIGIDVRGNIKNCPSMPQSFGNINDILLEKAIIKKDFQNKWNIRKDQISVCKDCEFRYICTDCRAFLEDPHDIQSKPLKCGYDPYSGEWGDWAKNPLKKHGILYYEFSELELRLT